MADVLVTIGTEQFVKRAKPPEFDHMKVTDLREEYKRIEDNMLIEQARLAEIKATLEGVNLTVEKEIVDGGE